MEKKRKTTREIIEEIDSTPSTNEGMNQETPQPELSDNTSQEAMREEGTMPTPEPQEGTEAQQPSEPQEVERIPVKIFGKEGEIVRFSDGRVIYFEDGKPKREFNSIQEALQKAIASDEKFQQASLLKKQAEIKEQELEEKKRRIAEHLVQAVEKQIAGGQEFIEFLKEVGYEIEPEQEELILENDTETIYKIHLDVVKQLKKQKDLVERELQKIQQEKMQSEVQEVLSHQFIRELDEIAGKPIGSGMLAGVLTGLAYTLAQQGSNLGFEEVKKATEQFVEDMNATLRQYAKMKIDELINEEDAMRVVDKILKKYPTIREKIEQEVLQNIKNKKEAGLKSAVPTAPPSQSEPAQEKTKIGKDFILKILKGG